MVVLCTSPLLRMPQLGFLGLQSVTCAPTALLTPWGVRGGGVLGGGGNGFRGWGGHWLGCWEKG